MAGGSSGHDTKGIYEVNLTPLIDVSLVLVVILLVATPMALQSSIAVQKAAAAARSAAEKARVERVEITVVSPDTVVVNRDRIGRHDLRGVVGPLLQQSATRQVAVRCQEGVTHGSFVGVLDEVKECGALQIAVQGR
jgi:biopolymer transport protein ExbD